ncbi:MAG TPA: 3'-5' exonuclease, partial [Bauldia sp.]|nr:3'-5' exonuclease [Bauldia sp.]
TIHSAKGQEWSKVFVLNCIDGAIPSDLGVGTSEEIEEERRLLYVAMTRAKDGLDLVMPQRCYVTSQARRGDRYVYANRTRFIPDAILDRFAVRLWPPRLATATAAGGAPRRVDLGARMRGMFAVK